MAHEKAGPTGPIEATLTALRELPKNPGLDLRQVPGTRAHANAQREAAQQSFADTFVDSLAPAVRGVVTKVRQEGALGLIGFRDEAPDGYDKAAFAKTLPPQIDRNTAENILDEDSLAAANRALGRALDELERGARVAQQAPGHAFAVVAGSVIDGDIPLILAPGGALLQARVAGATLKAAMKGGMTARAAARLSNFTQGINAGFQAGAVVGIMDQSARETAEWSDLAMILLASTTLGAGLNTALKGGHRVNMKVAEREFLARVARNDPNLTDNLNVEDMVQAADTYQPDRALRAGVLGEEAPVAPAATDTDLAAGILRGEQPKAPPATREDGGLVIGGEEVKGVGAEASGAAGRPKRVLEDPEGPIGDAEADWIDHSDEWVWDQNFREERERLADLWWAKIVTNEFGGFSTVFFHDLYKGQATMGNYIAGTIFESPSGLGRGRATSSTRMENYHTRIQTHIGRHIDPLMNKWANETMQPGGMKNMTWANSGYHISSAGRRMWSRELMLEMSDRANGRLRSGRHSAIVEAADRYEAAGREALEIGRGKAGETALDGFDRLTGVQDRRGYNPYRWDGFAINRVLKRGVKMADIEDALANGYRAAGMSEAKDAKLVAKAVLARARAGASELDVSVQTMMTTDGREALQTALRDSGVSEKEIQGLMRRLLGDQAEKGKESFAKTRNELDLGVEIRTTDGGEKLQLVDLLDNDMHRTWQRYARQMSGAAALARNGITNRATRTTVIKALQAEQRALGEAVTSTQMMEAMFSHFNAGPTHGFSSLEGTTNVGIGRVLSTMKRIANLGLLEKLGITQLSELGAAIGQMGIANYWRRGVLIAWDKELRAGNKALLDDVAYITGEIGYDERMYAEWLDLDDVSRQDAATWTQKVAQGASDMSSNGAFIQAYTSGFNLIRSYQQKVSMVGIVDKVFRTLKNDGIDGFLARAESELGLGRLELEQLDNLIHSGVIEFDPTGKFVNRIHLDKWDVELAETFGSALRRNMNTIVQRSMAGEQDSWMHTGWGSLMTHLMTFPMAAFQKQFIRHAKHMDMEALSTTLYGLGTAYAAIHIRDVIDNRDDTEANRAVRAFNYNNASSWIGMAWNPAATIMGLDDVRIGGYGPHESVVPPVFTQADALRRVPGALWSAAAGDMDYYDKQAIKALPFAGTYVISAVVASLYEGITAERKNEPAEPKRTRSKPDAGLSHRSLGDILKHSGVQAAIAKADG